MTDKQYRSHTCGELRKEAIGSEVILAGWVHRRRDHGGVIFIDLRDRFGLTQVVFRPNKDAELHEEANHLRSEWVIGVVGKVIARAEGMANSNLDTGEIEIEVETLTIYSRAKTPPFSIAEDLSIHEELRLKYRYLDMRRGEIIKRLTTRGQISLAMRNFFDEHQFTEVTTPLLGKSTPEGARDYLVPSRIYPGSFYALPQSPQIFKQLLMIGGLDRYFQLASCFRDEDLRADRQPEFMQLDLEMSFASQDALYALIEAMMVKVFKKIKGIELQTPFRRMTHAEAMEKYGTDKPDLRFGMSLHRMNEIVKGSNFSVFLEQIEQEGAIKGINVKGGADVSRRQIDEYTSFISKFHAKGLAWMKMQKEGPTSSITKFFDADILDQMCKELDAEEGDLLLFVAGPEEITNSALDQLRRRIAKERDLIFADRFEFSWITNFPLFEYDAQSQTVACAHHPFTSVHPEDLSLLDSEPLKARSLAYDLVLNGYELGSGSERIYDNKQQTKIFSLLKLEPEEIKKRFGFFVEALQYGTPPHLGVALGLDRLAMVLTNASGIRDVIAFPKTQKAFDLMSSAPSEVMKEQLTELKIHVHENT